MSIEKMSPTSIRLLGLRQFENVPDEEREAALGSELREAAWNNIETTTMPAGPKSEMKRAVALEVIQKNLIPAKLLRHNPMVYIGSGTDVEYPLALGGRDIRLVDPMFQDPDMTAEVLDRLRDAGVDPGELAETGEVRFEFDFGEGPEPVVVRLQNQMYEPDTIEDVLPEHTGSVVLFASQNPGGSVKPDEAMQARLADGGVILHEADVITVTNGEATVTELGDKPWER